MNGIPPSASRVPRLSPQVLIVLLWGVAGTANVALSFVGTPGWSAPLTMLATTMCGIGISLGLSLGTQRIIEAATTRAWPLLSGMVAIGASTLWWLDAMFQTGSAHALAWHLPRIEDLVAVRYNWVYFCALFSLQTLAQVLLVRNTMIAARERQLAEARLATQQATLAALRFQLNPHFLFNTLNAISTLVAEAGAVEADEMIGRLSDFLRATLATDPAALIALDDELETIQAYLEIEAVRFADRLAIRYDCAPGLGDALVPSLILQPLVENAIKYAVAPSRTPVTLTIVAQISGDDLVLVVEDDGVPGPSAQGGTGLGLRNVAARLEALFGARGRLDAVSLDAGFAAVVRMPLQHRAGGGRA